MGSREAETRERADEVVTRLTEPVSPELALIDPELAESARRELPLPTQPTQLTTTRPSELEPSEPESDAPEPSESEPSEPEPVASDVEESRVELELDRHEPEYVEGPEYVEARPRRRGRLIFRVVAILVLGGILLGAGFLVADRYGRLESPAPASQSVPTTSRLGPLPTAQARTSRPAARSREAVVTPGAARTFGWVGVPGVEFYEFSILRAGRAVLVTRTVRPQLLLPRTWMYRGRKFSLSAGRYRWVVRPAFGSRDHPRYGDPVIAAELLVEK